MGRTGKYEGVRARSERAIEIDFTFRGVRCRETLNLAPTPANLKRASQHRAAILDAISRGVFDYATTFPDSPRRFRFVDGPIRRSLTFGEYLGTWLEAKRRQVKSSTWDGYRKIVNMVVKSDMAEVELVEFHRRHVKAWCVDQKTGNKWLANVQSVLRTALQDAMDDEMLEANTLHNWKYENADALKREDDVDPFTAAEREAILEACGDPQYKNLFEFAFWTGMRTSELVALTWDDIDFIGETARVNKAKTQAAAEAETTKTKKGTRDVKLLAPALAALKRQKVLTFMAHGAVFLDPRSGKPWEGDEAIRQGPWKTAIRRSGVRYRRPYQTRHTYASMMLTAGEPLGWVAQQMGHSDLTMLSRTYARWITSAVPDAGAKAVAMFTSGALRHNCVTGAPKAA